MHKNILKSLVILLLLALPTLVRADAIVRSQAMFADTIAEFFVTREGVSVELEIGMNDIGSFRNLLPDQIYTDLGYGERPLRERLAEFFSKDMPMLADGEPLAGVVRDMGPQDRVLRDSVTGEVLPTAEDEVETAIVVNLFYPFGATLPGVVLMKAPSQFGTANVGFVAYHNTVAVNDFRYLAGVMPLELDWEDPWYSGFTTRSMQRSYAAPMSGFLYIEHFEIRKEIIVRPKDMQRWTDLGLQGAEVITAEQRGAVLEKIANFLMLHHPVTIDGKAVKPILDRANFLNRSLKSSMVVEPGIDISIDSAVVGVIFVYPTNGLPQKATMTWDLFDERIQRVPASSVDEAGPLPTYLEPDYAILEWENFLKNPSDPGLIALPQPPTRLQVVLYQARWWALGAAMALLMVWGRSRNAAAGAVAALTLVVVAASFVFGRPLAPPGDATQKVVTDLLRNVYKAFDYREESDIYDKLERSVSGDLLTRIYLETQNSLELSNQGGARAKVQSIDVQSLEVLPAAGDGFTARATWNVNGSVGHWGHVHQRINQYDAELDITATDGRWKLTGMKVLGEQRL